MNRYTKKYKNFYEFCKEFHTMEELLKWYKSNNVQWPTMPSNKNPNDKPMAWPDNLIKTKIGNCWDHAVFMHYFCVRNNIPHILLCIKNFIETEDEYWAMGHIIGLYQIENGWNFFNIHGQSETSNELGPYKSIDEAVKKYIISYSNKVYEFERFNSNFYNIGKKTYWYIVNDEEYRIYDKYYNNYKITQNEIAEECDIFLRRKYGMHYPMDKKINRNWIEIVGHNVKKWISDNIGRPLFKLGLPTNEDGSISNTRGLNMNKYTKRYKNFDEFCKEIKTMDELLKWYKANNVQWPDNIPGKDSNDKPMSWPDNLVRTKIGLCWDHALFAHYFCMKHHIEHKLMHIQSAIEMENEIVCFGHVITAYTDENGINFFDVTGREEFSKMYGPFKSYNDAIKNYVALYSEFACNNITMTKSDGYYKIIKNPFYIVLDENEISATYDKYYNNYKITQNQIWDRSVKQLMIKKYGANYPWKTMKNPIINRSLYDIATHKISSFISKYIGKPLYDINRPSLENGLMGSTGGVIAGAYGRPFVSQIMSSTFVRPKYALHDDIFTDNILTTNDNDTLQMMSSDYLKDKKVRVFKYVGKNPKEKMKKLLESIGKEVNREFIYESLSDKNMINDEQIYIDEDFEEIKFDEVKASIENEAYSVLNKYMNISPTLASRYSIVNTQEASFKLKNHSDNVIIMEHSGLGYFACNRNTLRRTKYYSSINDILIGSDIDE